MLSKNKIKLINSLKLRKYRKRNSLFLAEGEKIVLDLIKFGLKPQILITTKSEKFYSGSDENVEFFTVKDPEMEKLSSLKTPSDLIGIFEIKENILDTDQLQDELVIYCDDIQNPGNLGTIIRTADWFGIRNVVCSNNTADIYNPKVIQASMGSIASVNVFYVDPAELFNKIECTVYGTYLEGENIYETELDSSGIIVIGNEGKGISKEVDKYVTKKITIPQFERDIAAESLNASIAAGIICSEFRRR